MKTLKTKLYFLIFLMGISISLSAQKTISDCITTGNEKYSIINISRSYTYQEMRGSGKVVQVGYINDQPVCELLCQSRISIKIFSEGKMKLSIKFLSNKKFNQKIIDKQFHFGFPLEIDVVHGKTYFSNVDMMVKEGALKVHWTGKLVSIPESESMFREAPRFKKFPEIKECQENINNPFIK